MGVCAAHSESGRGLTGVDQELSASALPCVRETCDPILVSSVCCTWV